MLYLHQNPTPYKGEAIRTKPTCVGCKLLAHAGGLRMYSPRNLAPAGEELQQIPMSKGFSILPSVSSYNMTIANHLILICYQTF